MIKINSIINNKLLSNKFIKEANEYLLKNRSDQLIECLNKAIEFDPTNKEFHYLKGVLLSNTIVDEKLIKIDEYGEDFYYVIDRIYDLTKNKQALESFDQALNLDSDYKEALLEKCCSLIHIGEYMNAIEILKKLMDDEKYEELNKEICNYIAYALIKLAKYEDKETIYFLNKALYIDENYLDALKNKGILLFNLKQSKEAIELFNKILHIDPSYQDIIKFVY